MEDFYIWLYYYIISLNNNILCFFNKKLKIIKKIFIYNFNEFINENLQDLDIKKKLGNLLNKDYGLKEDTRKYIYIKCRFIL